jgi:RNA polymerase sigma-70 factor (ECF subfamily)
MTTPADDSLERADLKRTLTAALDSLPAGLRAVVMLRLVEGLSTRETASSLRMSESNVKVSLHRARALMMETLERDSIEALRHEHAFAATRCDLIVAGVFSRLGFSTSIENA